MALGVEVGNWSRPHCARMGPSSPPQKGAEPSNFRSISIVAKWLDVSRYQDATWYGDIGLSPGDFVLNGDPAPPQFSADVYCGQTAGWVKMPLGTPVGLGPNDIVLHGDPAPPPPQKKAQRPNFRPISINLIVAKRLYVSGYHLVQR